MKAFITEIRMELESSLYYPARACAARGYVIGRGVYIV